ncbi:MAG TPA: hypothetical protein VJB60_01550 [Candidatus Peribacterales bacterium]|nr:hypothetical protein [Candidatus Peribacterales bacterium]
MQTQKEILSIDPLSATKATALLGILWALLGWFLNSLVIKLFLDEATAGDLPPAFSIEALFSGVLGGFIGGALSGCLGCFVYNLIARKIGGIKMQIRE